MSAALYHVSRSFNVLTSNSQSVGGLQVTSAAGKLLVDGANLAVESYADPAGTAATLDAVITINYQAADNTVTTNANIYADNSSSVAATAAQTAAQDFATAADVIVTSNAKLYADNSSSVAAAAAQTAAQDFATAADVVVSSSANSYADSSSTAAQTAAQDFATAADVVVLASAATAAGSAISAALVVAAVAQSLQSIVDTDILTDDYDATAQTLSNVLYFVNSGTQPRNVHLPTGTEGQHLTWFNTGQYDLSFYTNGGVLQSIGGGNGVRCVSHNSKWYFLSC